MTDDITILGKDAFLEAGKPKDEVFMLPELGEGAAIRVRGYTVADMNDIHAYSYSEGPDGRMHYDQRNDKIYSILKAIVEPALTVADIGRILELADGIGDKIVARALELSRRTDTSWEEMKRFFRFNPYARRIYTVCAEVFHKLPSQLADVSEAEFNAYLAAAEVEAEALQEQMDKRKG